MREYLRESASQDLHVKDSLNITKMFNLTEDTDITEIQKQMADIGKMMGLDWVEYANSN